VTANKKEECEKKEKIVEGRATRLALALHNSCVCALARARPACSEEKR
jgi:hypothetical protein